MCSRLYSTLQYHTILYSNILKYTLQYYYTNTMQLASASAIERDAAREGGKGVQ